MRLRSGLSGSVSASTLCVVLAIGCGGGGGDDDSGAPPPSMSAGNGSSGSGAAPMAGNSPAASAGAQSSAAGSSSQSMGGRPGISGGPSATPNGNTPDEVMPDDVTPPPMEALEMLDPKVDWKALTIIFPTMYSAYDGVHPFMVPAHVDGATVALSDWTAIPKDSVTFDPDPEVSGGVMITIEKPVKQITIAANAGMVGGTAALFITEGTPEQWAAGEKRYNNGVEFNFDIDFSMVLDPSFKPPEPPPNLACNNCHTTGAKYFEIQHTPTQAARFSDDDLRKILTMGMKPDGVGFRILPAMLGDMTAAEIYAKYHRWETTPEEVTGLIIYLRSLTPKGQGDIRLPDGTYVAPGERPPNLPMMP